MYMFAKARTNIAILALYLFAWVIIGAGAFAFIAYQVVDISIPLLVGGGIVGGIFGIVADIMGILDVGNNQRWPYSNGLISNALNRTSVDVPESPTGLALPAPAEVEPWRRGQVSSWDEFEAMCQAVSFTGPPPST
jgi:hypothetical protein